MLKRERSFLPLTISEFRAESEGEKNFISGYASVYDQPTDKLFFREVVKPGAFTRALQEKQDVRALFNHDPSAILGRSTAGTLSLSEDKKGLKFRVEMPDTTYGRDVMTSIKRGDISQCSFGFRAVKQAWVTSQDPNDAAKTISTRELRDVDLGDVSPVTYPAYDGTSVGKSRAERRAMFPDGLPDDVRENSDCECDCDECDDGDCESCSHQGCNCDGCDCPQHNAKAPLMTPEERELLTLGLRLAEVEL